MGTAVLLALPLLIGIGRLSHRLGSALAASALPRASGPLDLDAAPRRALVVTLQLGVALATAVVVVAVTQPFLPTYPGPVLLLALVAAFGAALWRSATNLEGHVQAGAQAIVEALAGYAGRDGARPRDLPSLTPVHGLLTGLGEPVAVQLGDASPAVGKTLADLNLRGRTGASVLVIIRDGKSIVPSATEPLALGDVLAVAGTRNAIDAALTMLRG
jgi:CPA2 family monovalent cation:H+ antiporter-2